MSSSEFFCPPCEDLIARAERYRWRKTTFSKPVACSLPDYDPNDIGDELGSEDETLWAIADQSHFYTLVIPVKKPRSSKGHPQRKLYRVRRTRAMSFADYARSNPLVFLPKREEYPELYCWETPPYQLTAQELDEYREWFESAPGPVEQVFLPS